MPRSSRLPANIVPISVPTPFAIGDVNAYLLKGEPLTLVDPGPQTDEAWRAVVEGLRQQRTRPDDIELIILTHQHEDHVGMAAALAEASGAPIAGVPQLAGLLRDYDASMDIEDRYMNATMLRHGVDAGDVPVVPPLRPQRQDPRSSTRGAGSLPAAVS